MANDWMYDVSGPRRREPHRTPSCVKRTFHHAPRGEPPVGKRVRRVTVGSLFSGVGGFDLGLEMAGMRVRWQVENDRFCREVLRRRWPDVELYGDVKDVGGADLDDVDLICGGFPCQDLSVAGGRAGLAGERSGLFYEFMRITREVAPRWVLIENVPGLLSSNGGRDMGAVLGTLGELGYGWTYRVLDTQHFGPPQRRERVFIVGRAGGFCPPEVLLEPSCVPGHPAAGREAGEGVAGESARCLERTCGDWSRADGFNVVETLRVGAREQGAGNSYDNTPWGAFNWQSGGDVRQNPTKGRTDATPRRLTPRETERLQGFPDNWTAKGLDEDGEPTEISDTQRYQQCGNAVSVPVAAWIGSRIVTAEMGAIRGAA